MPKLHAQVESENTIKESKETNESKERNDENINLSENSNHVNFNPKIWGKFGWTMLQFIAFSMPVVASDHDRANMLLLLQVLNENWPCGTCRVDSKNMIKDLTVASPVFSGRDSFSRFIIHMRNQVAHKIGGVQVSYKVMKLVYSPESDSAVYTLARQTLSTLEYKQVLYLRQQIQSFQATPSYSESTNNNSDIKDHNSTTSNRSEMGCSLKTPVLDGKGKVTGCVDDIFESLSYMTIVKGSILVLAGVGLVSIMSNTLTKLQSFKKTTKMTTAV